jgi:hypothetical protein
MTHNRIRLTVAAMLSAMALLAVAEGLAAPGPAQRPGPALTRATPKVTPPGSTSPAGGGPTGVYGRGAQTPLQLIPMAKPNLVIYFPFDLDVYDRANPTVPLDIVGHPIINSGAYARPGRLRDSLRFGPLAPMFLAVPSAPNTLSLDITRYCTIATWVLPERLGGFTGTNNETILARGVTSIDPSLSYAFYLSSKGVPVFESRIPPGYPNPGAWTRQAARGIGIGLWRHLAVVFNAGAISFYIDGQPAGQATAPALAVDTVRIPQCPIFIGTRFSSEQTGDIRDPYFGLLDDLALWSRPLRADEIALLVSDADGNGIADYWDQQITGYLPAPIAVTPATSGTVTPTPIPPTPTRSPFTVDKNRTPTPTPTPRPSGPPFGKGSFRPTPTPTPTPPRIMPNKPEGRPLGPGSPTPTPVRRGKQGPTPTPTPTPTPKRSGPGSFSPYAPPPGGRG